MTRDEIRTHIVQFFKKCSSDEYASVVNHKGICHIQTVRDLFRNLLPNTPSHQEPERNLIILEIINEWVTNGLLTFGHKDDLDNNAFGFLSVTSYGEECFKNDTILPYDPDKYLAEYRVRVPNVDDITLVYLGEAITAYNRDLLLSSAITLGVASENAILLLIEAFAQAVSDDTRHTQRRNRLRDRWISIQYKTFRKELAPFESQIPTSLRQDIDTYLDGIFNFIRLNRNQAGHPTGHKSSKKVALHNMQMFVDYSKRVFDLKDFFTPNSLTQKKDR